MVPSLPHRPLAALDCRWRSDGDQWVLEDAGSTNGTYIGRKRVQRTEISSACEVRLGHPDDGATVSLVIAARSASVAQAGAQVGAPGLLPPPGWPSQAERSPSSVMAVGLLVSALVNSSDKTMLPLVAVVIVQVVLSGGAFALTGNPFLKYFSWLSVSRWGFGALASTSSLNQIAPLTPGTAPDSLWNHNAQTWLLETGMQAVLTAVTVGIIWWRLDRVSPGRRR